MVDTKVSALLHAGALQADDDIPLARGGANYRTTPADIRTYANVLNLLGAESYGIDPGASASTNYTGFTALIAECHSTGAVGLIGPGVHQVNQMLEMLDGVRLKGSGNFDWARDDYAYTDSNPTVIKNSGAITGTNSCVLRVSQMGVGVRGSDFTAPGTSDLQNIGLEDIHIDANGAQYAAYYYRCGNQSYVKRVSHSGATVAGAFIAGIFSVLDPWVMSSMQNTGKGFLIGQDTADTNLTDEAACNAFYAVLHASQNTGAGIDGKIARGSHVLFSAENNGAEGCIMRQTGDDSSGAHWEQVYSENNAGGKTSYYYDASNSLNNIVTLGYRHRGSGTIVKKTPFYGDDSTTVYSVTGGAGITAANLYVYVDGVRQTAATHYTVADNGADLDVTFVTAPGSTQKVAIHGNTTTTTKPDVFTIVADATDDGPSEPSNWLRVRGPQSALINSFINSNTYKWYLEGDGRTDAATNLHYIFREPEHALVRADFSEREVVVNGGVSVNQRLVTTGLADDTYCADTWYALTQTGTITFGQQTDPENGQPFCGRLTQAQVGAQRMGIAHIVESRKCRHLRGQESNFQARVRCSSSQAIRWAVLEHTGTADAVTSELVDTWTATQFRAAAGQFFEATTKTLIRTGSVTPSANTWTDLFGGTIRFTPSSSMNNLILFIWTEGTAAQNVTLDWGAVSIKRGGQKIKWEPEDPAVVLAECLRRCFAAVLGVNGRYIGHGQCTTTTTATVTIEHPVPMRAAPTNFEILSNVTHFSVTEVDGVLEALTDFDFSRSSPEASQWDIDVASGLVAGNITHLRSSNASAKLVISADL